jgi:hypothetical protein
MTYLVCRIRRKRTRLKRRKMTKIGVVRWMGSEVQKDPLKG